MEKGKPGIIRTGDLVIIKRSMHPCRVLNTGLVWHLVKNLKTGNRTGVKRKQILLTRDMKKREVEKILGHKFGNCISI